MVVVYDLSIVFQYLRLGELFVSNRITLELWNNVWIISLFSLSLIIILRNSNQILLLNSLI